MRKFGKLATLAYMVAVIVAMLFPWRGYGLHNPIGHGEIGDYVAHFIAFLPWAVGGHLLWRERFNIVRWMTAGAVVVAALEFAQLCVPHRGFNPYDIVAGEVGLLFSYLIYRIFRCTNAFNDNL